jgi:hypothetical protein
LQLDAIDGARPLLRVASYKPMAQLTP